MGYDCCTPSGWGGPYVVRRFVTKEERLARLQEYQDALAKELQAVKERIEEIEKA